MPLFTSRPNQAIAPFPSLRLLRATPARCMQGSPRGAGRHTQAHHMRRMGDLRNIRRPAATTAAARRPPPRNPGCRPAAAPPAAHPLPAHLCRAPSRTRHQLDAGAGPSQTCQPTSAYWNGNSSSRALQMEEGATSPAARPADRRAGPPLRPAPGRRTPEPGITHRPGSLASAMRPLLLAALLLAGWAAPRPAGARAQGGARLLHADAPRNADTIEIGGPPARRGCRRRRRRRRRSLLPAACCLLLPLTRQWIPPLRQPCSFTLPPCRYRLAGMRASSGYEVRVSFPGTVRPAQSLPASLPSSLPCACAPPCPGWIPLSTPPTPGRGRTQSGCGCGSSLQAAAAAVAPAGTRAAARAACGGGAWPAGAAGSCWMLKRLCLQQTAGAKRAWEAARSVLQCTVCSSVPIARPWPACPTVPAPAAAAPALPHGCRRRT